MPCHMSREPGCHMAQRSLARTGRTWGALPGCSPSKGPGRAGRQQTAQHSSCCQRHQVTAAWKGESGEAGISLLCPPPRNTPSTPLASPPPTFAAPGPALDVRPGGKAHPSGWGLPAIHNPKITTSIAATQVMPASPLLSVSPQHPTDTARHLPAKASCCLWHPRMRRGNSTGIPSANLLHHRKHPLPVTPSAGEQLRAGDRNHPMASHAQNMSHQHATTLSWFFLGL